MIRDEGSRFGTLVNDHAVASAFLEPGDRVRLANIELLCESEDPVRRPPQTPDGLTLVDPDLFEVLLMLDHPSVATALAHFLVFNEDLDWVDRQAAQLFDDQAAVGECARSVRGAYLHHVQRAQGLLPRLIPQLTGDWHGWAATLASLRDTLPPQVIPVGWLQRSA
jgi:hypothetical protein